MKLTDGIESIIKYLNDLGIEATNKQGEGNRFNREIEFTLEDKKYFIEWWVNESYLKLESGFSKPKMPIKYINVRTTSPTNSHHDQLAFYYEVNQDKHQWAYNEIPWSAFAIPFNVKK